MSTRLLKRLHMIMALSVLSLSVYAFDNSMEDADWGVKELEQAVQSANVAFLEKHGATLYAAISGFAIERTVQGNTAKAKVSYKDGSGALVTASFFCHAHGNGIDCH